jgi:hypothetical protein
MGAQGALAAYQRMVETLIGNLAAIDQVELRYTPDTAGEEIGPWRRPGWSGQPQGSGDLGVRMHRALFESIQAGAERVALIGSDCPRVTLRDIHDAWSGLDNHDVVLGPAVDGGYWLVALREPHTCLFEGISWGSGSVLRQTVEAATKARLRILLLRTLPDIDTEQDWLAFLNAKKTCSTGGNPTKVGPWMLC